MTISNLSGLAIRALHIDIECMLKFDDHLADISYSFIASNFNYCPLA